MHTCPEIINLSSTPTNYCGIEFNYDINSLRYSQELKNYVCHENSQIASCIYKFKKDPKSKIGNIDTKHCVYLEMARNRHELHQS